ncbi:co-chaperone GroES [Bacillus velezensis]
MLKPLGDRVVIELVESEEKTASGIVLPDSAKEKPQEGKIVAAWFRSRVGKRRARCFRSKRGRPHYLLKIRLGTEVKYEGAEYLILRESDILAVIG